MKEKRRGYSKMKIVVLDKDTLGEDIDLTPFAAVGEVKVYENTAQEELVDHIDDAEVVILNKVKLSGDVLCRAKKLKLICVAATGYDNIDVRYCKENSIALCNVPGYSTDSVAQLTVAMVLSLATHLNEYRGYVHSGAYTESGVANLLTPAYHELSSMTWGVVGGGNIGMKVAEIAAAMGCRVMVFRRKEEGVFPVVDLDTLCKECDVISLHLPLNEQTRGIFSRERIESTKKGVIIVNTARGAVTDEQALADAVCSGHIGGLGADVYSKEPFGTEHPFYKLLGKANVCLTPHMAWGSVEARARCVNEMAENIRCFYMGETRNRIV